MLNDDDEHLEEDENMQASIVERPLLKPYTGQALTIGFVANVLKVSAKTVRGWCEQGLIEAFQLPSRPGSKRRHWRIRGRAVDALINQQEKKPQE